MLRARAAFLGALAVTGCAVSDYRGSGDALRATPAEGRLWNAGDRMDAELERSGRLYLDLALTAYLQAVMDRLYPEFKGTLKVRAVDSPDLNAFALPNGSLYIHTGMLARLDNEAQLATVLGHEGAHFVRKHALRERDQSNVARTVALLSSVAGLYALLVDLAAVSSIAGYSQDMEREADRLAYERLVGAGYSGAEARATFEHLLAEIDALDVRQPYFFSTHPRVSERIESFGVLAAEQGTDHGDLRAREYEAHTAGLRVAVLDSYLAMGRHASVILMLERPGALARYPSYAHFHLGEAYRQRGKDGDAERAEVEYAAAIRAAPAYAPTYRALGLLHLKRGDHRQAKDFLRRYLEKAPHAPDRGYVEQTLSELERTP